MGLDRYLLIMRNLHFSSNSADSNDSDRRLLFKQFIQNKRHKYGIKLNMLTEPNGIIIKFAVPIYWFFW